jgi:hypothetical protein
MKLDPINLIGGFYQDDNLPWSAQDTVNWIPRPAEMPGTISQMKLVGAPGLSFLADIDDDPVRIGGFRNVEGRMFIVAGTTLYELNTDLTTTVRGTIPGAGPVTMAHNQLEFGNELCIGNGSGTLYVWNTWTNTFTVVTDDAATGSVQSVYLNRRIIHLDPFGRFGYPSDIDSATSYDALDRFDSEVSPDKFVGIGESQFELVGISQRTTEFYSDTGATEQPFRPKRIAINRGCAARNSIVKLGGTLAMLGDDGIFYRLQGYQWEPISTGPVNKAIEGNNWANCFGFVYEDRKHEIAYWTFPDGQTWGYDAWTGLIHRRESFGLNRWRINAIEKWNDMWIAGDFQSGRIYRIDWDAYHEAGQPLVARRVAPPIYNNGNEVVCPMIELVFDTGRGTIDADPLEIDGDLPDGVLGDLVTYQYTATGGIQPYSFSISSGSLPTGLSMDANGMVSGATNVAGSYSWTVRVTDGAGQTADQPDTAVISAAAMMATNLRHYTGPAESLTIAPANIPWTAGPTIDVVSLSPNGQYLIGSDADSNNANRLQFLKYNGITNTWAVLPLPATLPSFGPWSVSWHPSGDYVAIGVNASADRVFVYRRTGDTFTKIADPAVRQTSQSVWVKWSPDGTKLACSNANTGDNVWVYNFDATTGVLSGGKGGISTADQTAALAWVPNQNNRYLIRGNSSNMSLVDTTGSPNMTVVDSVTLTGAFSDATGGAWFSDDTTLITLGSAFSTNGPVTVWTINPADGANAINFAAYPATTTTIGPNKRCALKLDGPYFAIARDINAVATPFVYLVNGTTLTPFAGIPAGATGTVTNVSWRGAH